MSDNSENSGQLSPLKRALLAIEQLQARVAALEYAARQPIAVIGLGCRFPGANNPQEFWQTLANGADAIREVPANRWDIHAFYDPQPGTPGKMVTRWGGFIDGIDEFDAQFFGISPREAARMDPQQRLLLQVTWEALEAAGIPVEKLAGSRTGVFVGISNSDYSMVQLRETFGDYREIDAYAGTGNALSIAANRLSFTFDLSGPSIAVDTACSSSLVALNLAAQSLRRAEADLAIVGGVNLILSPELTITFSQAHMMAADGRCKTFDADADGYVRGEGCGVVILKRLDKALQDGDQILAVIYGVAVNQDGRSNGLTAPNGLAQQKVIQTALQDAGLTPADLDYIEAHGTGTILGDPIEIRALGAVFQGREQEQPCWVGSVKTNIGHTEAAAGIAGLIKVILALQNETIPPHLHLHTVNPYLGLENLPLAIPTEKVAWKRQDRPRYAGVSSFGFGGTNAHVILGEAPPAEGRPQLTARENTAADRPQHLVTLSGRSEQALQELAGRYQDMAARLQAKQADGTAGDAEQTIRLADLAYSANSLRSRLEYRLAVRAASLGELQEKLAAFIALDQPSSLPEIGLHYGQGAGHRRQPLAFLFTGQGAQYPGMAADLYKTQPVFRAACDACADILRSQGLEAPLGVSLLELLVGSDEHAAGAIDPESQPGELIHETAYTQPGLFIFEYAMARLWMSWGIVPDFVIGHSVGEYVAATIAGVFSLQDGLRLIAERGRLMQQLPKNGAMAAVFASQDDVQAAIAPYQDLVSVAGINGRTNIVISGEQQAVAEILAKLSGQGVNTRSLTVSHAFHSPMMEPILDEFEQIASQVEYFPPTIKLISNLTGRALAADEINAKYWRKHVRQAVQFQAGMHFLEQSGCRFYLEAGPNPVLIGMGKRVLSELSAEKQVTASWLPSAKQGQDAWETLLNSLGALVAAGFNVDWEQFEGPYLSQRRRIPSLLPAYPFQQERHWFTPPGAPLRPASQDGLLDQESSGVNSPLAGENGGGDHPSLQAVRPNGHGRSAQQVETSFIELQTSAKTSILSRSELQILPPDERQAILEDNIRRYLGQVLHLDAARIDLDRPIQFLGLDSIMAIELKGMVERSLGVNLPIASLLQGPSVAQLAGNISAQLGSMPAMAQEAGVDGGIQLPAGESAGSAGQETLAGIGETQRDAAGTYPLSYGQQAMWIQHQMDPDSVFNPIYCVRIRSRVSRETLDRAIQVLAERHTSLRTVFSYLDGSPRQRIVDESLIRLESVPAEGWNETEVDARLIEQANLPFNLETGPLVRIVLFSRSENEHFLLLAAHHIITDLWSLAILINELGLLYAYLSGGAALDRDTVEQILGPLPVQYTDFVQWQSKMLASERGEALWEYWRECLKGNLPGLELPSDHPRPAIQTYHGATLARVLDGGLLERLQTFSDVHGVTLYNTLLAAFNILLYRYTGQEDLIIGTPTMGRSLADVQDLVGYFVNPVALRSQLHPELTVEQLLKNVKQTVIEALDHQDFPFNLLVERLKPDRDPSRLPIFQVMFILQRAHLLNEQGLSQFAVSMDGLQMNLAGLQVESLALDTRKAQFDLTLIMAEAQGGLGASITYNTDLFEQGTIERMLGHYQIVLENILRDASQAVSQVNILTPPELNRLLVEFNDTAEEIWPEMDPDELCAHRIFEKQVELTPDAIAVTFEGQALTYRQLNQKANRLAHYLQMMGVGPEKIVGVCVDRSIDMIVAILAVMKAGGAYLPMDPVYPVDRLAFMIQDAKIPVLLTQLQLRDRLPTLVSQVMFLDINWEGQLKLILDSNQVPGDLGNDLSVEDNLAVPIRPDNLAYIIYTSGSTGRSKGVMIEHLGLVNTIWGQIKGFQIRSSTRQLQFASFSFDASISEIFTVLLSGGSIHLARREHLLSLPDLIQLVKEEKISSVTLPPSLLAMLPDDDFPDLETVVSAGESCTPEIALRWANERMFVNAYGPTEVSIGPTYYQIDGRSLTGADLERRAKGQVDGEQIKFSATVPIGKPINNTAIYILNEHRQPVPVGMIGELYIGGIGVARGYLNRADLTAEKFLNDPFKASTDFGHTTSQRLYRTGDLARFLPDGNIEFLGRVDFQVKLRGFRIELEEIESVLSQHPEVQQAVIQVRGNKAEERRLVAFLVLESNPSAGANEFRAFLRNHLPEYMIPSAFIIVDKLPLTPSGKIDRRAVASISDSNAARPELSAAYVPPQTEVERLIALIWQEVLSIERVGLNDNFFDLGGHSLLLYKAHSRMQEVFERSFSMVELFRYPTISALAEFLNRDPQAVTGQKRNQDRADQQKDAMKRQVDKMREIARARGQTNMSASNPGSEPLRPGTKPGINPGQRPGLAQKPVLKRNELPNKNK